MAQHGYLREYDEGWDRDDDRDRERSWRNQDRNRDERNERERGWGDENRGSDRDQRNFMFGDRDRTGHGRDDYSGNTGDRARSWFRDDDRQYRGSHQDEWGGQDRGRQREYGRDRGYGSIQGDHGRSDNQQGFGGRGDQDRSARNFSSHQDDHYRSWRDRQMSALDRDYADYCREREQKFHQDFDSWRQNRQTQGSSEKQHQKPGSGSQGSSEEVMELNNPTNLSTEPQSGPSPTGDATLGTNNSENSGIGRGGR